MHNYDLNNKAKIFLHVKMRNYSASAESEKSLPPKNWKAVGLKGRQPALPRVKKEPVLSKTAEYGKEAKKMVTVTSRNQRLSNWKQLVWQK